MAYFLMTQRGAADSGGYLIEMPARKLNQRLRDWPTQFYARVTAKEAHERVRRGDRHGTLLYIEGGKIRRSKEN